MDRILDSEIDMVLYESPVLPLEPATVRAAAHEFGIELPADPSDSESMIAVVRHVTEQRGQLRAEGAGTKKAGEITTDHTEMEAMFTEARELDGGFFLERYRDEQEKLIQRGIGREPEGLGWCEAVLRAPIREGALGCGDLGGKAVLRSHREADERAGTEDALAEFRQSNLAYADCTPQNFKRMLLWGLARHHAFSDSTLELLMVFPGCYFGILLSIGIATGSHDDEVQRNFGWHFHQVRTGSGNSSYVGRTS